MGEKVVFNTDNGCLSLIQEDGSSKVLAYINKFKIDNMLSAGYEDVKCVRIVYEELIHGGTLYPDEIVGSKV